MYLNLTTGLIAIAAVAAALFLFNNFNRRLPGAVAMCGVLLIGFSSGLPAIAAPHPMAAALGASERAVQQPKQQINENLKTSSGGKIYTGLEYGKLNSGKQLNDSGIERKIAKDISKDLSVGVTNGSVIVNGNVRNRDTAKDVIEQIKNIPGVHEVTYNLVLEKTATR